jgi:hypothetical protein
VKAIIRTAAGLVLVALLAGCAAAPPLTSPSPSPSATPTPSASPTTAVASPTQMETQVPINVPSDIIEPIVAQVAAEAAVAIDQVEIERAEAVTWRDGSLGCPEPGVMYIQVLIDGYWVVLRVGDQTYDFRVGSQGDFRLCPPGRGQPPL